MTIADFFRFQNVDLLTLGITCAAILILGFVVFFQNRRSATNRALAFFALIVVIHGAVNYASYQGADPTSTLWLIRGVVFLAVWFCFALFNLLYIFPKTDARYPSWYWRYVLPITALVSVLTLTPLVFSGLAVAAGTGKVSTPAPGPLIALFAATIIVLILSGIYVFLKKTVQAGAGLRKQYFLVLLGTFLSLFMLIVFVLILPSFFQNVSFVPQTPLFMLPFIAMTAYAIMRYHLLDIKVVATEILAFFLAIVSFAEVLFAQTLAQRLFNVGIFVLILTFSTLLIRSVIREIELREEVEQLAKNLEAANDKLKELDKMKSQFLSIASHDLRAPLTIIRNFMSLLLDGTYGKLPPAGQEGLQQVFDRATDMAKSVETYLNVSRIEQGRMKYDFVDVELAPMVEAAVKSFKTNAEKKGLTFSFTSSPELAGKKAKVDTVKMNEVLNNLFDNSIKYTPQGSIAVTLTKNGNMARLAVKDTGVGMSKETIGKLFQLFSTGDNSRKINVTSTGVGLYITKAHVEAHGGKVWAESEGEGKGSTFILELPLEV